MGLKQLFLLSPDTNYITSTVINAMANGFYAVRFANSETEDAKLIGFTITNANTDHPVVDINVIGSSPFLSDLIIQGNYSSRGMVACYYSGVPKLYNLTIRNNQGTVFYNLGPGMDIRSTKVYNNNGDIWATHSGNSGIPVVNSLFYNNTGNLNYGDVVFTNCTFIGNSQINLSGNSGFVNCIIGAGHQVLVSGVVGFSNNYFEDTLDMFFNPYDFPFVLDSSNILGSIPSTDLNNSDYSLLDHSIAIGKGISSKVLFNELYEAPFLDLYGNPRPNPAGSNPDIGAIESPLAHPVASLVTNPVSMISPNSAMFSAQIIYAGSIPVLERGFVWNLSGNPTISDEKVICLDTTIIFDQHLSEFCPNTTYYLRSYAINESGLSYGNEVSFTTSIFLIDYSLSNYSGFNVSGNGLSNGSIDFTINELSAAYVYFWSNGASSQDLINLPAGNYTLTLSFESCPEYQYNFTLTQPEVLSQSASFQAVTCFGGANGMIQPSIQGGIPPYDYLWSDGSTTLNRVGLIAGLYTLTVSDSFQNQSIETYALQDGYQLQMSLSGTSTVCSGQPLTISANTSFVTYSWSNGSSSETLSLTTNITGDLPVSTTYSLTVSDANACTASDSYAVTVNPSPVLDLGADLQICFGEDVTLVAGNYPVIAWSTGSTSSSISANSSGVYSVSVANAYFCGSTDSMNLTVHPLPAPISINTEICFGEMLTLNPGTYSSYLWSDASTSPTLDITGTGTYVVTVTDQNNCTASSTNLIVVNPVPVLSATTTQIECYGATTGAIDVNISGGTAPYISAWSNQAISEDLSELNAGVYAVVVTDSKGCSSTEVYTLTEPADLLISISATPVSCYGGNNGSINVTVSGGILPYSYLWSSGASTEDLSQLPSGSYTLTLTDANACTKTALISVNQPDSINVGFVVNNVSCNGLNNGSIDLTISGGSAPYTYLWSNGQTIQDIQNLAPGNYSVFVRDIKNCSKYKSFTIAQPAVMLSQGVATNIACFGDESGSISINTTGGNVPYSYAWSNGETGSSIVQKTAGLYVVTISDQKGCSNSLSFELTQPSLLQSTESHNSIICYGDNNGMIQLQISGGVAPYQFLWSNGSTTQSLSSLSGGLYSVTVQDANQCSNTLTVSINESSDLMINATTLDLTCFESGDGSISLNLSGATPVYQLNWSNGSTASTINQLASGNYIVTITDANNCEWVANYEVTQPLLLQANEEVHSIDCNGNENGSIELNTNGGTAPYSYFWSNGATSGLIEALSAGTYSLFVFDANNCSVYENFIIEEPDAIELNANVQSLTCYGNQNGSIQLTINGGVSPYNFVWSNGSSFQNINQLSGGTYSLSMSDANGCVKAEEYVVHEPDSLYLISDLTQIDCFANTNGEILVAAQGGTIPYQYQWNEGSVTNNLTGLSEGAYTLTLTDANLCSIIQTFLLEEPPLLTASISGIPVSCYGAGNGSIDLSVSGGVEPYSYQWSNGAVSQDLSLLNTGIYNVTVNDSNGCIVLKTFTITQPPILSVTSIVSDVSCNGAQNGSINLSVSGGTFPMTYSWSSGQATQDLSNLPGGEYFLTIVDAKACHFLDTFFIEEPEILLAIFQGTDVSCFGGNDGLIDIQVSGGSTPYNFVWTGGSTNEDLQNAQAGFYNQTITDANGCTFTETYLINQPSELLVDVEIINISSTDSTNGSIHLTLLNSPNPPYTYHWNNGESSEDLLNLSAGIYVVSIIDNSGCEKVISAIVPGIPLLPDWEVTPTSLHHTIIIPVNSTVEAEGISLSTGDYLGVFYLDGGEEKCGGMVQYTALQSDTLIAYGTDATIKNGFDIGESFRWKVWIAATDNMSAVHATYLPTNQTEITAQGEFLATGLSKVDSITSYFQIVKSFPLIGTWNMISLNIRPHQLDLPYVFNSLGSNVLLVKNENGQIYWPQYSVNLIGNWLIQEGYQIKLQTADTLVIEGVVVNPEDIKIQIPEGWSMIGYPRQEPANAASLLSPIVNTISIVKNYLGQVYWPAMGLNGIGNLKPGQGYQIKVTSSIDYYFPGNDQVISKAFIIEENESVSNTGVNMTLGIPISSWSVQPDLGSLVSVFGENGLKVGSTQFEGDFTAISIWGDDTYTTELDGLLENESYYLEYYKDGIQNFICIENWHEGGPGFSKDKISVVGSLANSIEGSVVLYQNFPNPFSNESEIKFYLPEDDFVSIKITNYLGERISFINDVHYKQGEHIVKINATNLSSGAYTISLITRQSILSKTIMIIK